jgi:hypothetical protein
MHSRLIKPDKLFQRVHIWRVRKANPSLSIPALARLCAQPLNTVRRAVKLLETAPKDVLQAFEHEAVSAWVQAVPVASAKGDHRPAKDLLLHTRAIEPVQLQGQTQIAILFSGAAIPGLSLTPGEGEQIIDISSKSVDSDSSVQGVSHARDVTGTTPEQGPGDGGG